MNTMRIPWIVGIVLVAAAAIYLFLNPTDMNNNISEKTNNANAAARVNSQEISKSELDSRVAQNEQTLTLQGQTGVNKDELRKQTLDQMINEILVLQASTEADVSVSEAEIDQQLQAIVQNVGGREMLDQQMQNANLTEAMLKSEIKNQIAANKYVEDQIGRDFNITDEEVNSFYEIASSQQELPPVEQVRPQIEAQLKQQKQNEAIVGLLDKLRAEADIEILI